jgi:hypothetical protein
VALFFVAAALALVLLVAACVGTAARMGGADPGLGFSSMGGHAPTVGERWPTVSAGDRIVAVGGRPRSA